jgi:hypothetical protein
MNRSILLGFWKSIIRIPRLIWQSEVSRDAKEIPNRLDFMTEDHHRIRDYVVFEIPRLREPITPKMISESLDLNNERVNIILSELERNMTFLFRDQRGAVTWAYPVTVDRTPHQVTFSSGEQIYAA